MTSGESTILPAIPVPVRLKQIADVKLANDEIRDFIAVDGEKSPAMVIMVPALTDYMSLNIRKAGEKTI